jgi:hypothetical protein
MITNGKIPSSFLQRVGWALLAPGAAAAWLAFAADVKAATGIKPTITSPDGAYRPYARQVYWKKYYTRLGKGSMAATPGHSNHGLGTAIDISNYARFSHATLVRIARKHGFVFDVSGEGWHIHYLGSPNYSEPAEKTVRLGQSGPAVLKLQTALFDLGYYKRKPTGKFGLGTKVAVQRWQKDHGFKTTGKVGPTIWAKLGLA